MILPIVFSMLFSSCLVANDFLEKFITKTIVLGKEDAQFSVTYVISGKHFNSIYGCPYELRMKNISAQQITISPAIIRDSIPKEQVISAVESQHLTGVLLLAGVTGLQAFFAKLLLKANDEFYQLSSSHSNVLINPTEAQIQEFKLAHPDTELVIKCSHDDFWANMALYSSVLTGASTAFLFYQFMTVGAKVEKELFYDSITLEPGQEVTKLCWVKDNNSLEFETEYKS